MKNLILGLYSTLTRSLEKNCNIYDVESDIIQLDNYLWSLNK